jgi:hypothetical protein
MSCKLKEKEGLARRDVERFWRMLRGRHIGTDDLLALQRVHDRLVEVEIWRADKLIHNLVADGLKRGATPGRLVQISKPLPRYVYHGTSETAAASILKEGITPRGSRTPNHPDVPSHPELRVHRQRLCLVVHPCLQRVLHRQAWGGA